MNAGRGEGEGCVAGHAHRDGPDRLSPRRAEHLDVVGGAAGGPSRVTAIDETGPEVVNGKEEQFIVVPPRLKRRSPCRRGGAFP